MAFSDQDKQYLERMEQRIFAAIEKTETALLTEFHKWASPFEMRQRSHSAAFHAVDAEIEHLKDRVSKLEGRTH